MKSKSVREMRSATLWEGNSEEKQSERRTVRMCLSVDGV